MLRYHLESDRKEVFLQTLREIFNRCSTTEDNREQLNSYFVTFEEDQHQSESPGNVEEFIVI